MSKSNSRAAAKVDPAIAAAQQLKSDPQRMASLMAFGSWLPLIARGYRAAADKSVHHIGLSSAMAWPLVMIGRQGDGVRPGALAEVLAIEGASLVRHLDQLVDAGLIERREHSVDRRAKTLHLTTEGSKAREKIEDALNAMRSDMFEDISDEDLAACLRVFSNLDARFKRSGRPALVDGSSASEASSDE